MIQELTFDELKKCMAECTDKMLMFVIMMANGELMNRCDKNTLGKKDHATDRFTQEQKDWICWQIGEWYLGMKPLLEGQHNLGHMKERLKTMICDSGEVNE